MKSENKLEMSLNKSVIERLKCISPKNELLAHGYIRLNALMDIPSAIIQICMAFLLCFDEWDINCKGKHLEISGINNEIVECTNPDQNLGANYQTVLGKLCVSSGKHHWRFKIIKIDLSTEVYGRIIIGVIKVKTLNDENLKKLVETYFSALDNTYGFIANFKDALSYRINPKMGGSVLGDYGICCKQMGDIIDMYLDIDNQLMSFAVNEKNYGYVYHGYKDLNHKIEKVEYKMGLSSSRKDIAIELVSYEEIDEIPH